MINILTLFIHSAAIAITFSCAAIHVPAVYNLQSHQRPVPHIHHAYMVWAVKDPLSH